MLSGLRSYGVKRHVSFFAERHAVVLKMPEWHEKGVSEGLKKWVVVVVIMIIIIIYSCIVVRRANAFLFTSITSSVS